MKKILVILTVVFVVFVGTLAALPFIVKVDQYRPKIIEVANQHLNGKLELGELNLSVWGTLKVKVAGLKLTDLKNQSIVAVKEAYFQIPWTSILGGSPLLTFVMDHPEIQVVKEVDGKLNILGLAKKAPEAAKAEAGAPSNPTGEKKELPGFVTRARLGIAIEKANLRYKDELQKSVTDLKDLDIRVKDLSLSRETEIEIAGTLSSSAEKLFKVTGPFLIKAEAEPTVVAGEWKKAVVSLSGDFSNLEVQAAQAFSKAKGIPAKVSAKIEATPDFVEIQAMAVEFFNVKVNGKGKVTELKNTTTGPVTQFSVQSNRIELKAWNELIPALKEFSLSGNAGLSAEVFGPSSAIQYKADLDVKDFKAKSPMLKSEPMVNMGVSVSTDKVDRMFFNLTAPGNDLNVEGSVLSFKAPKITLTAKSNSLDLDQLIHFPKADDSAKASESKSAAGNSGSSNGNGKKPEADLDALLDPVRQSEVLRKMSVLAKFDLKLLKAYEVRMTDISSKWTMSDLVASIDSFAMKVFDGSIQSKFSLNMKPKAPAYQFSASVNGLDLQKAMTSKMQLFKDTVVGKLILKMDGNGASFNPNAAKQNLNSKGSVRIENAVFQSIDIGKMASEAINKALEKVGETIPALKGKQIKSLDKGSSKYEVIFSDFTIAGGRFTAPNFVAKAALNQGIDLKGFTQVGLLDQELKAEWQLIDTYNLMKAKELSVEVGGVKIEPVITEPGQPLVLPVSVGCKYTAPCASYGKVPEALGKIAIQNTKRGATQVIKKQAEDKLKDAGKKLLKGLFN
jgi:uncharacterized protein involved in outer membrane biogenesis